MKISLVIATLAILSAAAAPTTAAEELRINVGTDPWIGYGLWQIAEQNALFEKHGVSVKFTNFADTRDTNTALVSGSIDVAGIGTHQAMILTEAGAEIRLLQLIDYSKEADAIIAPAAMSSISDLKGKSVAFQEGSTSHLLLNFALASAGLSTSDITIVPMSASDAGAALLAGKVDVAVTYEPYITVAREQNPDLQLLVGAGTAPGLVSDVLAVRKEFIDEHPNAAPTLRAILDEALAIYRADPTKGQEIISKWLATDPKELKTAFDGISYYSSKESRDAVDGDFGKNVIAKINDAAIKAGMIKGPVDIRALFIEP